MPKLATAGSYTFPKPRVQKFSETQAEGFFKYWISLGTKIPQMPKPVSEETLTTVLVRVYRDWPRRKLIGLKSQDRTIGRFEGRCPFTLDNWEEQFKTRFGSGIYTVWLNEAGVSGGICYTKVKLHDVEFPPLVAIDDIDLGHPDNADFVQQLRNAGKILPGDEGFVSEEMRETEEMERQENSQITGRLMDMASDLGELRARVGAPASTESSVDRKAAEGAIALLTTVTTSAVENANKRADAVAGNQNLPQLMEMVGTLLEKTKPDMTVFGKVFERSSALEGQVAKLHSDQLEQTRRDLEFYRNLAVQSQAAPAGAAGAPERQKSLKTQLEDARELYETFRGGGGGDVAGDKGFWEKNLPAMMQLGNMLIGTVVAVIQRTQQPQPIPGQPGPPMPVMMPGAALPAQPQGAAPGPPVPPAAAVSTDPNIEAALRADVPAEVIPMLQRLTEPVCSHFVDSEEFGGYSLANWVITGGIGAMETPQGRGEYELIGSVEAAQPGNLLNLLALWPPIWTRIGGFPPARVQGFVRQFLTYDEWTAQQAQRDAPQ